MAVRTLQVTIEGAKLITDLSLHACEGSVLLIAGHNGAGKTTLMRTLAGLQCPAAGAITLDGVDVTHLPPHRRAELGFAYAPQEQGLFPRLTVKQNLQVGLRRFDTDTGISILEKQFAIAGVRSNQLASTLSGGQYQILKFTSALVRARRVLLLDEPSQGVQPAAKEIMAALIGKAARERGLIVIVAEQDLRFARSLLCEWVLLDRGIRVDAGLAVDLDQCVDRLREMARGERKNTIGGQHETGTSNPP